MSSNYVVSFTKKTEDVFTINYKTYSLNQTVSYSIEEVLPKDLSDLISQLMEKGYTIGGVSEMGKW